MNIDDLLNPEKSVLVPVLKGIAQTLGPWFEVVIHDLKDPDHSLVFIEGNVTGRQPGAPVTDLVLKVLRTYGDRAADIIGYETRTRDGRRLRSSTMFLRDEAGRIRGCVCVNVDVSAFEQLMETLKQFTAAQAPPVRANEDAVETFPTDVSEVLALLVQRAVKGLGKPPSSTDRAERVELVRALDRKGAFLIKGAVDYLASILGVSRYTVYAYLEEARATREDLP